MSVRLFVRLLRLLRLSIGVVACSAACGSKQAERAAPAVQPEHQAAAPPAGDPPAAKDGCAETRELATGLILERHPLPDSDACLTLVRIDPANWRFEVRTAAADGEARTAPGWADDFGLTGVINTSMFADDQRSIGFLRDARAVNNPRDNPKLGGFLAFDPVDAKDPPVAIFGRGCPGFDLADLEKRYRGLVQNYRMLDCSGKPIVWADEKTFSAAAIAVDHEGRLVFLHSRTPFQMTRLNEIIADRALDLAGAIYVEGGPEASLYVKTEGAKEPEVAEMGSFETDFFDDSNHVFWRIPNVLAFAPQPSTSNSPTSNSRSPSSK